ncbi:MAG TPA: restriction endonuclease subunit S [Methanocorpusculum sp.]|nr:restriction endonuclease subunit S [Methanocorpusculum sp.]
MVRLGDIAKITKGTKVERTDRSLGTIRFLQIGDLRNDNCIKWCDPSDKYTQTTPDDVVIAWDGANAGTIGYGLSGVIGSTLAKISFNRPLVSEYIGLYLQGKFTYLQETCNGATIPHINRKALDKLQLPLPPLAEQKRIADVLDTASGLIKKRKEQIRLIDQLAKSLFVEMFGDPVENPRGWEHIQLDIVCHLITDGTHQPPKYVDQGIPFLLVSNIVNNNLTYETEKYITRDDYKILIKRTPVVIGDILLSIVGSYGNPAIIRSTKEFCFQRHIAYIKPNQNLISSVYLHSAFLSSFVKNQIEDKVKGVAQKTLNLSELKKIIIPLPPLSLQKEFADRIDAIEKQKALFETGLEKLEMNYRALMQEYFG